MLEFCYLPISGGYFICQIAILTMILEAKYHTKDKVFDCYFSASGGNIAAYICSLFDINKESIIRVLDRFNSKLFLKNNTFPNLSFLLDSGIYNKGQGFEELIHDLFDKEKIYNMPEIWTLTYNTILDLGSINCNKSKKETFFKNINVSNIIDYGCYEINFLDGDIDLIGKTCLASASIPGITKSIKINDVDYVDGGIANATSGSYFSELYEDIQNSNSIYHYVYIYPCKLDELGDRQKFINKKSEKYWFNNIFNAVNNFTCSSIIKDRHFMFQNWLHITQLKKKNLKKNKYINLNLEELIKIFKDNENRNYFMTFSCEGNPVNISDFNSNDIKQKFTNCYNTINLEIFY